MAHEEDIEGLLSKLKQLIVAKYGLTPTRVHVWVAEETEPMSWHCPRTGGGGLPSVTPTGPPKPPQSPNDTKVDLNKLSAPPPTSPAVADQSFEPNDFQAAIFVALEYKAMHGEELAAAVDCNARTLYKKNGIKELIAAGWVKVDTGPHKLGYFRPDAPPEELSGETAGE